MDSWSITSTTDHHVLKAKTALLFKVLTQQILVLSGKVKFFLIAELKDILKMKYDLIEYVYNVCAGAPKLKNRRINVYNVVSGIYNEGTVSDYIDDFGITIEEAIQAVNYCKRQQCLTDKPYNYCDGCTLRMMNDETCKDIIEMELGSGDKVSITSDNTVFLGDASEYYESELGKSGWLIAEELLKTYTELTPNNTFSSPLHRNI